MVSVIIPNYNYSQYLEKRINSVLKQTYRDFEVIFLDDASDDGSVELAEKILKESERPYSIEVNRENSGSVFSPVEKGA